ncbi:ATP-binding protein [Streptomyces sp. NPDC047028]|uniref:ATP-binding protein n=1 Tax=Streptomyces sp. NPDC047028 TaxID=3155793 RepID=UPI0033F02759
MQVSVQIAATAPDVVNYLSVPLTGAVAGMLGGRIVRARHKMTFSTTILYGILGCVLGFLVLQFVPVLLGHGFPWLRLLVAGVVGVVIVMGTGQLAARRWTRHHPDLVHADDVTALIATGESNRVEFKSSARWNSHTQNRDERLEQVIAKTVAAFLNADGGTLLIGVDDTGAVLGIENDYRLVRQGDQDRYELWLHDLLGNCLGKAALSQTSMSFPRVGGRDICRIDIEPAPSPVFLRPPKGTPAADFYVRLGNSTRQMRTDEVLEYASYRWPRHLSGPRHRFRRWLRSRMNP